MTRQPIGLHASTHASGGSDPVASNLRITDGSVVVDPTSQLFIFNEYLTLLGSGTGASLAGNPIVRGYYATIIPTNGFYTCVGGQLTPDWSETQGASGRLTWTGGDMDGFDLLTDPGAITPSYAEVDEEATWLFFHGMSVSGATLAMMDTIGGSVSAPSKWLSLARLASDGTVFAYTPALMTAGVLIGDGTVYMWVDTVLGGASIPAFLALKLRAYDTIDPPP